MTIGGAYQPNVCVYSEFMASRYGLLRAVITACTPLPALTIGLLAMRQLGLSVSLWSMNIAATGLGLVIWFVGRRLPPLRGRGTRALVAAASISAILLPFASEGMLGIYRWVAMGGLRLHASAIASPVIILCVSAAAPHSISSALAIGATGAIILALQPDAAQTISLAAACAVVLIRFRSTHPRRALLYVAVLLMVSIASFLRRDPLPAVPHVEGIFHIVASKGPASAAMAAAALLLLPVPFFTAWLRSGGTTALALGVYVAMTVLAPAWGTFPVPIMGYGASPILGYFLALAIGLGGPSRLEQASPETASSFSSA